MSRRSGKYLTDQSLLGKFDAMTSAAKSLHDEIRQTRPFRSMGEQTSVSLLVTADRVRRALGTVMEAHGLTLQQYNVLRILRGAGKAGLPTLEIAHRMIEQTPGITRLLDRLEAKQLVRRERRREDRRQVFCWITPGGLELLDQLEGPVDGTNREVVSQLQPDEQAKLVHMLDAVRAGLKP